MSWIGSEETLPKDLLLGEPRSLSLSNPRLLSENYYNPKWSGFRRLKNTCVVMEWLPGGSPADRLRDVLSLSETEDGLMRKCCQRALDLFTAEGNATGAGGQLNQDRVQTLLRLVFDQGPNGLQ